MQIQIVNLSQKHAGQNTSVRVHLIHTPMGRAPVAISRHADGSYSTKSADSIPREDSLFDALKLNFGLSEDGVGQSMHIDAHFDIDRVRCALPDIIKVRREQFTITHPKYWDGGKGEDWTDAECDTWVRAAAVDIGTDATIRSTIQGRKSKGQPVLTVVVLYAAPSLEILGATACDKWNARYSRDVARLKRELEDRA